MSYAHGVKWNKDTIELELKKVIRSLGLKYFPSLKEIEDFLGNSKLTNAISKNGGSYFWAKKLGCKNKKSETQFGNKYETICASFLTSELHYDCEQMNTRYPYDLTVNKHIKIDVKVANIFVSEVNSQYYTFNLEKNNPTCDIFICYCIKNDIIEKIYVIPSNIMQGKTQLSVGKTFSKYDIYINNWDIIKKYDNFYNTF